MTDFLRLNPTEKQVFEQKVAEFAPPNKEQVMKLTTSWKEEGIEEGKVAEAQGIALRQLPKRIGALSESQEAQIRRLPLQRLEDLTIALLDFTQPGDLEAWLQETSNTQAE